MSDVLKSVDRASDAAFSINQDLHITGWNMRLENLTGYSSNEVLGQHCGRILKAQYPTGAPLCQQECRGHECLLSGRPFAVTACHVQAKDGTLIEVEFGSFTMQATPTGTESNRELAVILVRERDSHDPLQKAQDIRIYGFGDLNLVFKVDQIKMEHWRRKQAVTLLKVLLSHNGKLVHRERLAAILWPDADEVKSWERLRVAIYALRKELKAAGIEEPLIETVDKSYRFNLDKVWIDFRAFEASNEDGLEFEKNGHFREALQCFENAQKLYRGDYLASDIYADWCAEKREQLRELYLEVLTNLVRNYEKQLQFAQAAQTCRTALACDPCRESFLQSLIRNLVRIERPERAQAEYLYWQSVLLEQLGVEPLPETRALYHNLVNGLSDRPPSNVSQT